MIGAWVPRTHEEAFEFNSAALGFGSDLRLLLTLVVFIVSRSALENIGKHREELGQRTGISGCRLFA